MQLDPTVAAILAIIGGALSAGGLASKFIEWLSNRTTGKTTIDAKTIDAELTVNERLLARIGELEKREDVSDRAHAEEIAALRAELTAACAERDQLARREHELLAVSASQAREIETMRADHIELRRHAERVEAENRKMRDATGRVRRPT